MFQLGSSLPWREEYWLDVRHCHQNTASLNKDQKEKQQRRCVSLWSNKPSTSRCEPQKGGLINDSCLVFVGMITFTDVKKQEFLECPKRNANWGYFCHRIWFVNKEQKDGGTVRWVALALPQNGTCCVFGSGFELLHRVFKRESYYPWFREGRLRRSTCTVCLTFTKPAAPHASSLKVIIHAGATWNLTLPEVSRAVKWNSIMHIVQVDGLLRWNDSHLSMQ